MMCRTRSAKISAPPPGIESTPASRMRCSVSRIDIFPRLARKATSTIVNAFTWTEGKRFLSPRTKSHEVLKRQVGMQTTHNVKLSDSFGVAGGSGREGLLERHRVSAGVTLFAAKGTQPAGRHTHISGVDMAIDVEVRDVSVQAFPNVVRQPATARMSPLRNRAIPSSKLSRSATRTFSAIGRSAASSVWKPCWDRPGLVPSTPITRVYPLAVPNQCPETALATGESTILG